MVFNNKYILYQLYLILCKAEDRLKAYVSHHSLYEFSPSRRRVKQTRGPEPRGDGDFEMSAFPGLETYRRNLTLFSSYGNGSIKTHRMSLAGYLGMLRILPGL